MRRRSLPTGARLSSFGGLGLRSLRARPLRSLLTAGGIVLGVGMVFGVLLLVGTINGTFNKLFDSIYGDADVVVSGEHGTGSVPAETLERVEAVDGWTSRPATSSARSGSSTSAGGSIPAALRRCSSRG